MTQCSYILINLRKKGIHSLDIVSELDSKIFYVFYSKLILFFAKKFEELLQFKNSSHFSAKDMGTLEIV